MNKIPSSNYYLLLFCFQGISFNFGAMTVDPKSTGYDPSPLKGYLKSLNVPYYYEEQGYFCCYGYFCYSNRTGR